ncbi:hypothetical protein T08_5227 [Trichinella sp. T8]|nr:hypothetical protein T08_5227 [Trichinella sp. T8]
MHGERYLTQSSCVSYEMKNYLFSATEKSNISFLHFLIFMDIFKYKKCPLVKFHLITIIRLMARQLRTFSMASPPERLQLLADNPRMIRLPLEVLELPHQPTVEYEQANVSTANCNKILFIFIIKMRMLDAFI